MRTTAKIAIPVAILSITGASLAISAGTATHTQPTRAHFIVYCHTGVSQAGGHCTEGALTALRISGSRVAYVQGQWVTAA
jgi:hypothetical protein